MENCTKMLLAMINLSSKIPISVILEAKEYLHPPAQWAST